jgi:hypothetical protein
VVSSYVRESDIFDKALVKVAAAKYYLGESDHRTMQALRGRHLPQAACRTA